VRLPQRDKRDIRRFEEGEEGWLWGCVPDYSGSSSVSDERESLHGRTGVTSYPLIFRFDDVVSGEGFVGRVTAQGRALLVREDEGFWLYGVTPGGISAGGHERSEALNEFKRAYYSVLLEIADEATSAGEFEEMVRAFFSEESRPMLADWKAALGRVREGEIELDMERVSADERPPRVDIITVDRPRKEVNPSDQDVFLEAA
jgi:hypothetical protein